jgi:hypothetical protein
LNVVCVGISKVVVVEDTKAEEEGSGGSGSISSGFMVADMERGGEKERRETRCLLEELMKILIKIFMTAKRVS